MVGEAGVARSEAGCDGLRRAVEANPARADLLGLLQDALARRSSERAAEALPFDWFRGPAAPIELRGVLAMRVVMRLRQGFRAAAPGWASALAEWYPERP